MFKGINKRKNEHKIKRIGIIGLPIIIIGSYITNKIRKKERKDEMMIYRIEEIE
ncbi:hypothetical protein [Anaerococcus provencensis]|uniref:hypothetical protein n=1 Tax=Anaerococcus provencensis TaxID=938293 RepID=UPI0002D4C7EF|nr:hypothetical protein [Anaerococcus provencensis]